VGVTGYNIYRDDLLIDTSPINSYSDTGLDPVTEYEYEVSAFDAAANESARSDPDSATTAASGDTEAPSVPQNLSATAISDDRIDLTWEASTDNVAVTGYNIYRDNVLVDTSPTNSYSDTGLDPVTEYEYEVSAFDAASNESARSAPDSATTHQVILTAGLIGEWRFDEGTGQVIVDHSGNGFHATLGSNDTVQGGEPTWASYGVDCVLSQSQNWINTNSNLGLAGGVARTVICVAQINDSLTQGGGFGSWNSAGVAANRWWFTPQTGNPANLQLIVGSGSANFVFSSLNPMPFNTWMFLACTQSGANLNTCVGYRDGASQASTQAAAIDAQGNFEMMSRGNSSGVNKWGKIAYQLVYNRALSAAEITQTRQALKDILAGRGITLP
jgi:chitodextrinase